MSRVSLTLILTASIRCCCWPWSPSAAAAALFVVCLLTVGGGGGDRQTNSVLFDLSVRLPSVQFTIICKGQTDEFNQKVLKSSVRQ